MLTYGALECILSIGQLYVKHKEEKLILIVAKLTDDFLMAGSEERMKHFIATIGKQFVIWKSVLEQKILFSGCEMEQDRNGSITMSMHRYMKMLKDIHVDQARRNQILSNVTELKDKTFRSLAETLLYLEIAVMPQGSLIASLMQQSICKLKVQDIVDANASVSELLRMRHVLQFIKLSRIQDVAIVTFSDAVHAWKERDYGQ